VVTTFANRGINSKEDGIGECQFDLAMIPTRTENPQIGNDPLAGTDDGERFFSGEKAILV
jgi:hypothetical protein